MNDNIVIITRVYERLVYEDEKKILGKNDSTGRIIFGNEEYYLELDTSNNFIFEPALLNIPQKNLILCLYGGYFTNNRLKKKIKDLFLKLNIRIGICHPGTAHTLNKIKEDHPFLNDYEIGTYSGEEEAEEILTYLNNILNSTEEDRKENLNKFYSFISKKIFKLVKKKIILLWLPLAINIQGLSEIKKVNDEEKVKKYWKEIKGNNNFINLLNNHEELTTEFKELKLDEKDKNDIRIFLEALDNTNEADLPNNKFLKTDGKFFFPKWFEEWIGKINNK